MNNNVYGIDFGTCNLKVFCKASGKILNEKNTIALINKNEIYAYGDEAYAMYEKAPESIEITFPVVNGVIADFNNLQNYVFNFLEYNNKSNLKGSDFVVAVPTDITNVEKRAFYEIFDKSKVKARSINLCEKPIADAVGMGLDANEPTGIMIVNLGADTTEISVISLGGLVLSELLHFGGNRFDESIISYLRREYNLVIGQKTAKALKETIGSGLPGREDSMVIVGRNVVSGLPVEMEVKAEDVYKALQANLENICYSIKLILEKTPPELAKDIIHSGIYITGGGAQIDRLADLFTQITNIKVNVAENPEETAVRGLVKIVSEPKYKRLLFKITNLDLK
ncbi:MULTISPECIES: rod shape-determining protein [Agathobacter]|uniref:Cell shape-determining protein MreB n=1 Tax=Agathobacter ruminis TaxID=1712665 RepID=A0A2G3E5Z8_9FIRM|nr:MULTISPECIES: rod shape-determining protein [Agathobacter]MBQ1680844.1 rod shape-determining protein [Agathobacter sp.]MCR5677415.1 rod shape-determining protein [Agathobacter sp.]MDC7302499.1 rod shape-determining protein [Agathobacter ruminis]PHU38575.1 rod shape-determining protein [Agathobacter ruminis]